MRHGQSGGNYQEYSLTRKCKETADKTLYDSDKISSAIWDRMLNSNKEKETDPGDN